MTKIKSFFSQLGDAILSIISYPFTNQERRQIDAIADDINYRIDTLRYFTPDNFQGELDIIEHQLNELRRINNK